MAKKSTINAIELMKGYVVHVVCIEIKNMQTVRIKMTIARMFFEIGAWILGTGLEIQLNNREDKCQ